MEGEEKRVEDLANTSADSHLPAAQDELLKVSTFVSQLGKAHNENIAKGTTDPRVEFILAK